MYILYAYESPLYLVDPTLHFHIFQSVKVITLHWEVLMQYIIFYFQRLDNGKWECYHADDHGLIHRPILLVGENILTKDCKYPSSVCIYIKTVGKILTLVRFFFISIVH